VGGLLTPWDTAVTVEVPTGPAVQTWGLLSESHVPAQATPLAAIDTTAVLLETKVMTGAGDSATPWLFWATAVKFCVPPCSSETDPGDKVTRAGSGMGRVRVLVPHPHRPASPAIAIAATAAEATLPMNPPQNPHNSPFPHLENPQCRGSTLFGQVGPHSRARLSDPASAFLPDISRCAGFSAGTGGRSGHALEMRRATVDDV
jgi:hypothetical protein